MTIELDADVFDTLELTALAFGGIGRGTFGTLDKNDDAKVDVPCCIYGHAYAATDTELGDINPIKLALHLTGHRILGVYQNDGAVRRINRRKRRPIATRVSWEEYTKELGIVRKESA